MTTNGAIPPDPEGLRRARELAQWKLGYRAWADDILEAYFTESSAWKKAHEGIHGDDESAARKRVSVDPEVEARLRAMGEQA